MTTLHGTRWVHKDGTRTVEVIDGGNFSSMFRGEPQYGLRNVDTGRYTRISASGLRTRFRLLDSD